MSCPRCEKGNLVRPTTLGFYNDPWHVICDNEDDGSGKPCEYWEFDKVTLLILGIRDGLRKLRKQQK